MPRMTKTEQRSLAGKCSGQARLQKYGVEYFQRMGRMGGRPHQETLDEIKSRIVQEARENEIAERKEWTPANTVKGQIALLNERKKKVSCLLSAGSSPERG